MPYCSARENLAELDLLYIWSGRLDKPTRPEEHIGNGQRINYNHCHMPMPPEKQRKKPPESLEVIWEFVEDKDANQLIKQAIKLILSNPAVGESDGQNDATER